MEEPLPPRWRRGAQASPGRSVLSNMAKSTWVMDLAIFPPPPPAPPAPSSLHRAGPMGAKDLAFSIGMTAVAIALLIYAQPSAVHFVALLGTTVVAYGWGFALGQSDMEQQWWEWHRRHHLWEPEGPAPLPQSAQSGADEPMPLMPPLGAPLPPFNRIYGTPDR